MMRTNPLSKLIFQSAMNTAYRKISAKRGIPLLDWEQLAHVQMNGDHKWAQQVSCQKHIKYEW